MRIKACQVYAYTLSYAHGDYVMSGGRAAQTQESTLVRLLADNGEEGWGEIAPLAGTYLPNFVGGARAAINELAPELIGADPRNISNIHRIMDGVLLGQSGAKSVLDIACWDLFGKSLGVPVSTLLGGVLQPDFALYEAIPLGSPESMADFVKARSKAGIKKYQVKVGNDPYEDAERVRSVVEANPTALCVADSNGGWNLQNALIASREMKEFRMYLEQPCRESPDCAIVAKKSEMPIVMDESIVSASDLFYAKYEIGAGSLNVKLSRFGGLMPAARIRDLAQGLGMSVTIEDTWGGDVTTAAVSHLAATTRPDLLLSTSFFNDWTNEHVATEAPRSKNGRGSAPTAPGLGVKVDAKSLGKPIFEIV
ncbi:mandelate racemase/muconate lactonizing enzyme family protein [Pseudorhodoplanes sp.]|uniref:mandelate racemase/muconate lactonizing enzyme family protein n=1 Tax=Pseudorhodoplanes sp. TaxID=1934341 RepID=UPI003D0F5286